MSKLSSDNMTQRVTDYLSRMLDDFLSSPQKAEQTISSIEKALPQPVVGKIKKVLALRAQSYRDGLIIQLGYGIVSEEQIDLTKRQPSGREVAKRVGSMFKERHISYVQDAFQNIGKNYEELCRGNQKEFDDLLVWMVKSDREHLEKALRISLAIVSLTARAILDMPRLARADLTFYRVSKFLNELLSKQSGGAYQQFAVAAFIQAIIDEFDMLGPGKLRVETKSLNASDASSRTAGDIQILRGNRTEEAFEVTANDWKTKIESAKSALKEADLQRIHIVANAKNFHEGEADKLEDESVDLSVVDVNTLLYTLTALMRKPARDAALTRMYELLERNQPSVECVNEFVTLLRKYSLVL